MKETLEEMRETIEEYGINELIQQYVMHQDAEDLIVEYIDNLRNKLTMIEYEIDNSDMITGIYNIIKIIKG